MEVVAHYLVLFGSGGIGLLLIQVGIFVREQRYTRKTLDVLVKKQSEMNGSVQDVIRTVAELPCEVEKRRSACPGPGGG